MSKTPETLSHSQIECVITWLNSEIFSEQFRSKSIRNKSLFILLLDTGLRVAEISQLRISDLIIERTPKTALRLRSEIAKNHKERTIPLGPRAKNTVADLIANVWTEASLMSDGFAFQCGDYDHPITTRQIQRIIKVTGEKALGLPLHPHQLRHTFASRVLRVSNIRVTQQLLGHSSIISTQIYTHPNHDDLDEAINAL